MGCMVPLIGEVEKWSMLSSVSGSLEPVDILVMLRFPPSPWFPYVIKEFLERRKDACNVSSVVMLNHRWVIAKVVFVFFHTQAFKQMFLYVIWESSFCVKRHKMCWIAQMPETFDMRRCASVSKSDFIYIKLGFMCWSLVFLLKDEEIVAFPWAL